MNRSIHIFANKLFINENSVLVVVAFPSHKADKGITSERDFAVIGSGTVSNYLAFCDLLAGNNDGTLINTCTVVGTEELNEFIFINFTVFSFDNNLVCRSRNNGTCAVSKYNYTRVNSSLVFDTCTNEGAFGNEKRNSLLLHV